jgi:hypothetical protein
MNLIILNTGYSDLAVKSYKYSPSRLPSCPSAALEPSRAYPTRLFNRMFWQIYFPVYDA